LSGLHSRLKWARYIEVVGERGWKGYAHGVCLHGDYLVVVGSAGGQPYMALLDRVDGRVVSENVDYFNEGSLYNCVFIGGRIYTAGSAMEFFEDSTGRHDVLRYTSIISDGAGLLVAGMGYKYAGGDVKRIWIVERRDLSGETTARRVVELGPYKHAFPYDAGFNPVTGSLWVVGGLGEHFLAVILDKNLDEVARIAYSQGRENSFGSGSGVCFDSSGHAYVAGGEGVAKFAPSGELVAVNREYKGLAKIACIGDRVYAFGDRRVKGYRRHVLVVFDSDLNVVERRVLSKNTRRNAYFTWGKPAFDENTLYAAGWDEAGSEERIVVYAIQIASPGFQPQS